MAALKRSIITRFAVVSEVFEIMGWCSCGIRLIDNPFKIVTYHDLPFGINQGLIYLGDGFFNSGAYHIANMAPPRTPVCYPLVSSTVRDRWYEYKFEGARWKYQHRFECSVRILLKSTADFLQVE